MLDLIVLGQIPGTNIQITLAWFAMALLTGLIWADVKLHKHTVAAKTNKRRSNKARA